MNWTQVDIYTTTDGIDLLCSDLMDLGIRGFSIQDAEDFNEFLQNKDGKWDYIDEDLMGLSHCESCVTIYLPEDAQGAETLQMVQELLKREKGSRYRRQIWQTGSRSDGRQGRGLGEQLETVFQAVSGRRKAVYPSKLGA